MVTPILIIKSAEGTSAALKAVLNGKNRSLISLKLPLYKTLLITGGGKLLCRGNNARQVPS